MLDFLTMVALTTFVVTITGLLLAGVIHLAVKMESVERAKSSGQRVPAPPRLGYALGSRQEPLGTGTLSKAAQRLAPDGWVTSRCVVELPRNRRSVC